MWARVRVRVGSRERGDEQPVTSLRVTTPTGSPPVSGKVGRGEEVSGRSRGLTLNLGAESLDCCVRSVSLVAVYGYGAGTGPLEPNNGTVTRGTHV